MNRRHMVNESTRLLIRKTVLQFKIVFLHLKSIFLYAVLFAAKAENLILKIRYLRSKGGYGPMQIVKLLLHLPKLSVHEMDLLVLANR